MTERASRLGFFFSYTGRNKKCQDGERTAYEERVFSLNKNLFFHCRLFSIVDHQTIELTLPFVVFVCTQSSDHLISRA